MIQIILFVCFIILFLFKYFQLSRIKQDTNLKLYIYNLSYWFIIFYLFYNQYNILYINVVLFIYLIYHFITIIYYFTIYPRLFEECITSCFYLDKIDNEYNKPFYFIKYSFYLISELNNIKYNTILYKYIIYYNIKNNKLICCRINELKKDIINTNNKIYTFNFKFINKNIQYSIKSSNSLLKLPSFPINEEIIIYLHNKNTIFYLSIQDNNNNYYYNKVLYCREKIIENKSNYLKDIFIIRSINNKLVIESKYYRNHYVFIDKNTKNDKNINDNNNNDITEPHMLLKFFNNNIQQIKKDNEKINKFNLILVYIPNIETFLKEDNDKISIQNKDESMAFSINELLYFNFLTEEMIKNQIKEGKIIKEKSKLALVKRHQSIDCNNKRILQHRKERAMERNLYFYKQEIKHSNSFIISYYCLNKNVELIITKEKYTNSYVQLVDETTDYSENASAIQFLRVENESNMNNQIESKSLTWGNVKDSDIIIIKNISTNLYLSIHKLTKYLYWSKNKCSKRSHFKIKLLTSNYNMNDLDLFFTLHPLYNIKNYFLNLSIKKPPFIRQSNEKKCHIFIKMDRKVQDQLKEMLFHIRMANIPVSKYITERRIIRQKFILLNNKRSLENIVSTTAA